MKNKKWKLLIVLVLLLITTGCTKTLTDSDKKLIKFFKDGYKIVYEDSKSFKIRLSSQLNSAIYDIDDILDDEDFDLWIGDD